MRTILSLFLIFIAFPLFSQITIEINPGHTRAISGHSELNRLKYFNISDRANNFENNASDKGGATYFLDERKISFGRDLGMVFTEKNWGNSLKQDFTRPGFADINYMINAFNPNEQGASFNFQQRFTPNLDIVNHDRRNGFPDWMAKYTTLQAEDDWIPQNIEASTEILSTLLKYKYTDFHRPAYYELVNEPHWSFWGDQHFANWHTDLAQKVRDEGINTLIGGPCLSVGYFYRNSYQDLSAITNFIDNTNFELDFYSYHIYDYYDWNESQNEFTGTISTGLPSLGVIDALANYTRINHGKPAKLVISEHGGYISQADEAAIVEDLGSQYFPGNGFEYELEKRSIINFIMVNSTITNTFTFMENPHIFLKTVPFILFETSGWNPAYYSSLMVPWNFTSTWNWAETKLIHYYQFFQNAQGRRVRMHCPDPDLQYSAFVSGDELNVLVNNMANKAEILNFDLPAQYNIDQIELTKLSRQNDFRPIMEEEVLSDLDGITIAGRGAIALKIKLTENVQEELYLNEISFFSNEVGVEFEGQKTFNIPMDDLGTVEYAYMRIGIHRPANANKTINVSLNGTTLTVPLEDSANRFTSNSGYASTKIIPFNPNLLDDQNQVVVSFLDGQEGGVGSVVIQAAIQDYFTDVKTSINPNKFTLFPNPSKNGFTIDLDQEVINKIDRILIYDNIGRLIDESIVDEGSSTIRWNMQNEAAVPPGVYYVFLKDKEGFYTTKQWVKQ